MSAVELWKPWQLLFTAQDSPACSEWRFVNIAENKVTKRQSAPQPKISSAAFNSFSAYFPIDLHNTLFACAQYILNVRASVSAKYTSRANKSIWNRIEDGKMFLEDSKCERDSAYCNASIKRVIVRFKSLSERRNSSILLIECNTVV